MAVLSEVTVKVHDDEIIEASVKGSSIHAFCFPRTKRNVPLIKNTLSQKVGVYLLIGRNNARSSKLEVYIGHGDVVGHLSNHHSKKMIDRGNNWIETVVIYDSKGEMTVRNAHAVEGHLIEISTRNSRWKTINKKGVSDDIEREERYVQDTIDRAVVLTRILGWDLFRSLPMDRPKEKRSESEKVTTTLYHKNEFIFASKSISARMVVGEAGKIVVLEGSEANLNTTASTIDHLKSLRNDLIQRKVLIREGDRFVFGKNQEFSRPSTAGSVIAGYGVNGNAIWINSDGTTYGDWLKKNKNR